MKDIKKGFYFKNGFCQNWKNVFTYCKQMDLPIKRKRERRNKTITVVNGSSNRYQTNVLVTDKNKAIKKVSFQEDLTHHGSMSCSLIERNTIYAL